MSCSCSGVVSPAVHACDSALTGCLPPSGQYLPRGLCSLAKLFSAVRLMHNCRFYPVTVCSALLPFGRVTMASADSSALFLSNLFNSSFFLTKTEVSPGNAHIHSHLCLPHILICLPGKFWTLAIIGTLSDRSASYVVFCSSGQCFAMGFLQTSPHDFAFALQLILPLTGRMEDFHLQVCSVYVYLGCFTCSYLLLKSNGL